MMFIMVADDFILFLVIISDRDFILIFFLVIYVLCVD